ncbi:MAG: hypothetical protein AAFV26_10170, partial [Pseudomonadota bacterium]
MTVAAAIQFGVTFALQLGFSLLQNLLAPDREGPRLKDRSVATADYGQPLGFGYGTVRMSGHVISRADYAERENQQSAKGGPQFTEFEYFWTGAIAFASREAAGLVKLYADGEIIYDAESDDGEQAKMAAPERIAQKAVD